MTNLEKIRTMSAEELARFLVCSTSYRESPNSQPTYLDFRFGEDTHDYDEAVRNTKQWLEMGR